jgi:hypothetical protein
MKTYGEWTLDGGEWSASHPGPPGTHCTVGWVGLRASIGAMEKRRSFPLPGMEPRPISRKLVAMLIEISRQRTYLQDRLTV